MPSTTDLDVLESEQTNNDEHLSSARLPPSSPPPPSPPSLAEQLPSLGESAVNVSRNADVPSVSATSQLDVVDFMSTQIINGPRSTPPPTSPKQNNALLQLLGLMPQPDFPALHPQPTLEEQQPPSMTQDMSSSSSSLQALSLLTQLAKLSQQQSPLTQSQSSEQPQTQTNTLITQLLLSALNKVVESKASVTPPPSSTPPLPADSPPLPSAITQSCMSVSPATVGMAASISTPAPLPVAAPFQPATVNGNNDALLSVLQALLTNHNSTAMPDPSTSPMMSSPLLGMVVNGSMPLTPQKSLPVSPTQTEISASGATTSAESPYQSNTLRRVSDSSSVGPMRERDMDTRNFRYSPYGLPSIALPAAVTSSTSPVTSLALLRPQPLSVNTGRSTGPKHIYVSDLPLDVDEFILRRAFRRFGRIDDVRLPRDKNTGQIMGFAYLKFSYEDAVQRACEANGEFTLNDQRVTIAVSREEDNQHAVKTLFLANVWDISEAEIINAFGPFGEIEQCDIVTDRGMVYVHFTNVESAKKAHMELQGLTLNDRYVRIEYAQSTADNRRDRRGRYDYRDNMIGYGEESDVNFDSTGEFVGGDAVVSTGFHYTPRQNYSHYPHHGSGRRNIHYNAARYPPMAMMGGMPMPGVSLMPPMGMLGMPGMPSMSMIDPMLYNSIMGGRGGAGAPSGAYYDRRGDRRW